MAKMVKKSFDAPEETRSLHKGKRRGRWTWVVPPASEADQKCFKIALFEMSGLAGSAPSMDGFLRRAGRRRDKRAGPGLPIRLRHRSPGECGGRARSGIGRQRGISRTIRVRAKRSVRRNFASRSGSRSRPNRLRSRLWSSPRCFATSSGRATT